MSKIVEYIRIALSGQETSYTTGSIRKAMFILSVPIVLEMLMEGLFSIIDMLYISRLGSGEALATIAVSYTHLTLPTICSV